MQLTACLFVSDLHGDMQKYQELFQVILKEHPQAVFLGGDLLPHEYISRKSMNIFHHDFINEFMFKNFFKLKQELGEEYPKIFIILGNDDARFEEASIISAATKGIWHYAHNHKFLLAKYPIYGYANIPPSPFILKDWERYDVSRYVDPGCISPEEGRFTVPVSEEEIKFTTIEKDLKKLTENQDLNKSIFLFHSPPYQTALDRVALDGRKIDHCPVDVHIGSIAIKRFIESRQPRITLHGHVHESTRITGKWMDKIGQTFTFSAAHDGPELALIRFSPENPEKAERELIR